MLCPSPDAKREAGGERPRDVAEGRRGSLWVPPYPPWEPGDLRTQEILKKTKHLLVLRNTTMGV